ncbi:MAG: hypothetical protein CTY20_07485 [Hyphomicrobium sp.]|nr:MAG: hypothetical protein CTY20_07485 [Hyphomicrobium sp.]
MVAIVSHRAASVDTADAHEKFRLDWSFLFESLLSDLHWSAFQAGTVTCLLNASDCSTVGRLLQPWRNLLQDNSQIAILGLRYHEEMDLPRAAASEIVDFYSSLAKAKSATRARISGRSQIASAQAGFGAQITGEWWSVCTRGIKAFYGLEPLVRQRLPVIYVQNAEIIVELLREAAAGETRRVNEWGEITLPVLVQRRSTPRISMSKSCRIRTPQGLFGAKILNASSQGLGIASDVTLAVGQSVSVELDDRKAIQATVVWTRGGQTGLRLSTPLSSTDPFFGARN